MRRSSSRVVTYLAIFVTILFVVIILRSSSYIREQSSAGSKNYSVEYYISQVKRLQLVNEVQATKLASLSEFETYNGNYTNKKGWYLPIPVLVFVCARANATREHVSKLLRSGCDTKHPIIVSQDCNNTYVSNVLSDFGSEIISIKPDIKTPKLQGKERRYAVYYRIANHYYLGLKHVFDFLNYTSVIVTEDDLDIAADFFSYFDGTRWLLEADDSIFCISAWNDNGKSRLIDSSAKKLLYRSDFFPGLGWMISRTFWNEIKNRWPPGYWDDWIREPEQRRNRSCIRPEISRTAMTHYGKLGASRGLFFNQHLRKILLSNGPPVSFPDEDLSYLLRENYDQTFLTMVYSVPQIKIDELISVRQNSSNVYFHTKPANGSLRIEYDSMDQFLRVSKILGIMADTKAGVPRTAYQGIVSCFIQGIRIFVAPNRGSWHGYDLKWEAPPDILNF